MSVPSSSSFAVLVLTNDTAIQALVRQIFKDASATLARDLSTFQKELSHRQYDAVVMESQSGQEQLDVINDHIDSSCTLCIRGSKAALKKTLNTIKLLNQPGSPQQNKTHDASLESYLEVKMGEFVKGMRNGSAKNLHPILISAVERPLITSALRETRGNQIQAAELLGLNRNTLRKKIVNLHIPLKQTKARANPST